MHKEPDLVSNRHRVEPGENLFRIAQAYGVTADELARANGITDPEKLAVGQELIIPTPTPSPPPSSAKVEAKVNAPLQWPLVGVLYAKFGPRGEARHDGIDISAPDGTPVGSAADGEVIYSGDQKGYGHIVIVQHANGLLTLYAHNRENLVKEGQKVRQGDPVARVGNATRTSGPHLHFEVREGGTPKDPMKFLPPPR